MNGISTQDLCKSYGRNAVLSEFSFTAPQGETTLLAGLNGAGKTTWIRLALGLAAVDSGCVSFSGKGITEARGEVSVVLDEPPVYPTLSGEDNLYVLSGGVRVPADLRTNILDMLTLPPEFLRMRGKAYSLGQRKRLAVAVALFRQPRYLFLDEPTIGLDPLAWQMVREALRTLRDGGCTIVLTGQDFTELTALARHVVVLHDGKALYDGAAGDLTKRRPPRVWVETPAVGYRELEDWSIVSRNGASRFERQCETAAEAEVLLASVRSWDVPVSGMGIVQDSLEEAFLSLVQGDQGRAR